MSRRRTKLYMYKNSELINIFNELMIRTKIHLFEMGDECFKSKHSKPTNKEIDEVFNRIIEILKQDKKQMRT